VVDDIKLTLNPLLSSAQGVPTEIAVGLIMLALVYYIKRKLVSSTKDFVIANRKIGFGFGVAGLISIWTWAMAVMMSAAQTPSLTACLACSGSRCRTG
jgi:urea-proton symporter